MTASTPFLFVPVFSWPAAPGGKLHTYAAGGTTPITTYAADGVTPNSNPVTLDSSGSAVVRLADSSTAYHFVLKDSTDTTTLWDADTYQGSYLTSSSVVTAAAVGAAIYPRTASEIAAGVTPSAYNYPSIMPLRYGGLWNNSNDETSSTNTCISVASQTISGAVGNVINLPLGTGIILSEVTLTDDVRFLGTNKNGSIFQAAALWNSGTSPYMFHAVNGTSSMFDSILESMTIDCNNIAGLGCVQSDAWQENCGPRRCLFYQYTTIGLRYSNGFGGASFNKVEDCEFFPSTSTATATAGIQVDQISLTGTFMLSVRNVSIASNVSYVVPKGINIVNDSSSMDSVHFEYHTTGIYLDGLGSHTLENITGGPGVTNVVEIAATFLGAVRMIGCRRGGASNLVLDHRVGGVGTITFDEADLTIGTSKDFAQAISGISVAASAIVTISTVSGSNPIPLGALLTFTSVTGMTQINGLQGTVSAIGGSSGAWTATVNINSSGFTAYTGPSGRVTFPPCVGLSAGNAAKAWCYFDGTLTGTHAPTIGFNVTSVTRNSAGDYTINMTNAMTSASSAISVTSPIDAVTVTDKGGGAASREFVLNVLSVSAGALVKTPTDATGISFMIFGNGP